MICLAVIALVFGIATGAPTEHLSTLRIVGGQKANQEEFNYQVSLLRLGSPICGGALLTKNTVITAAHCVVDTPPHFLSVRVGSGSRLTGGKRIDVVQLVSHSEFSMDHFRNDVSILRLAEDVEFSKNIGPVKLTSKEPAAYTTAVISGWGYTKDGGPVSNDLMYAKVPIIDRNYCQQSLRFVTQEMICAGFLAGGIDACQGDSGGPLVANNELVGIVSWGKGCARPDQPGVYTNVAYLRSWINTTIKTLSE